MKKTIALISAMILAAAFVYAAAPMRLFLSGLPMNVHPMLAGGKIYLPLLETASLFHFKARVDWADGQIAITPESEKTESAGTAQNGNTEPSQPGQSKTSVILGQIRVPMGTGLERPAAGVKIKIFTAAEKYDAEENRKAVEAWISRDDRFYANTHGLVNETASDSNGAFAFSNIPPGDYELVAIVPVSSMKTGYWWEKIRAAKGETIPVSLEYKDMIVVSP